MIIKLNIKYKVFVIIMLEKHLNRRQILNLAREKTENSLNKNSSIKNLINEKTDRHQKLLNNRSSNQLLTGDKENPLSCLLSKNSHKMSYGVKNKRELILKQQEKKDELQLIETPIRSQDLLSYQKQIQQSVLKHKISNFQLKNMEISHKNIKEKVFQEEIKMMRQYSDYVKSENKIYADHIMKLQKQNHYLRRQISNQKQLTSDFDQIQLSLKVQKEHVDFGFTTDESYRHKELEIRITLLEKEKIDFQTKIKSLEQNLALKQIQIKDYQQKIGQLTLKSQINEIQIETDSQMMENYESQTELNLQEIVNLETSNEWFTHSVEQLIQFCNKLCFEDEQRITFNSLNNLKDIFCQCLNSKLMTQSEPFQKQIKLLREINFNLKKQYEEKQEIYTVLLRQAHRTINCLIEEMKELESQSKLNYIQHLTSERNITGIKITDLF